MIKNREFTSDEVQEVLVHVEQYLQGLQYQWDVEHGEISTGWSGWLTLNKKRLLVGTIYVIDSLDRSIQFVEELIPNGEDKKLVVMTVAAKLFDYCVKGAFPVWMAPFIPVVRSIVLNIVISQAIDFIVKKYNEGSWKAGA